MNEDLLELAYSKMETESSYEDFKKDFESDLNLQELVYSKFDTEASFEDFIKDVFGEVKKKDESVSISPEEVMDGGTQVVEEPGSLEPSVQEDEVVTEEIEYQPGVDAQGIEMGFSEDYLTTIKKAKDQGLDEYETIARVQSQQLKEDQELETETQWDRSVKSLTQGLEVVDDEFLGWLDNKKKVSRDKKITDSEEEQVRYRMEYLFEDYGYEFEEFGVGDNIKITAPGSEQWVKDNPDAKEEDNPYIFKTDTDSGRDWFNLTKKAVSSVNPGTFIASNLLSDTSEDGKSYELAQFMERTKPASALSRNRMDEIIADNSIYNSKVMNKEQEDEIIKAYQTDNDEMVMDTNDFLERYNEVQKEGEYFSQFTPLEIKQKGLEQQYGEFLNLREQLKVEGKDLDKRMEGLKEDGASLDLAVGEYVKSREKEGSFVGGLAKSIAKGYGIVFAGATGLAIDITSAKYAALLIATGMPAKDAYAQADAWSKKTKGFGKGGGSYTPFSKVANQYVSQDQKGLQQLIRDRGSEVGDKIGTETSEEYIDSAGFVEGSLYGVAESVPAMMTGIGGLFTMAVDIVNQETENNPLFKDISELEKLAIAAPIGVVGAALEKVGLSKALKGTAFTKQATLYFLKKFGAKATTKSFSEFVSYEMRTGGKKLLTKSFMAALSEAETGGLQEVSDKVFKNIYNEIKGQELFQETDTWAQFFYEVGEAAVAEGIGGAAIGSVGSVVNGATGGNFGEVSNETFSLFKDLMNDPYLKGAYEVKIKRKIIAGEITKAEGKRQMQAAEVIAGVMSEIPDSYSEENQRKALQLLLEKKALEDKISKSNKLLVKGLQDRVDGIDNSLEAIGEANDLAVELMSDEEVDLPQEIKDLNDDEVYTFTVETLEDVPESQRGNAEKVEGADITTRQTILGIPVGPETTIKSGVGYTYTITGKEAKTNANAIQESSTKDVDVQEPSTDSGEVGEGDTAVQPSVTGETQEEGESESDTTQTAEEKIEAAEDARKLFEEEMGESGTDPVSEPETVLPKVTTEKLEPVVSDENLSITEEVDGESDPYYATEQFSSSPEGGVTAKQHENRILKRAEKAVKAIKKILPKTKIILHRSEAAYTKAINAKKGDASSGSYVYNNKDGTGTIHVNVPRANKRTIAHEVFHAVLISKYNGNEAEIRSITKRMLAAVKKNVKDRALKNRLQEFSDGYEKFNDEEYLAELVGFLGDNYNSLGPKGKNIIKRWLEKIGEILGREPEINVDADVLELLNTIGKSVKRGEEIQGDVIDKSFSQIEAEVETEVEVDTEAEAEADKPTQRQQIIGKNARLSRNVRDFLITAKEMAAAFEEEFSNRTLNPNASVESINKAYKNAKKESDKAIRRATGWEVGKDGLWRYEINDIEANIKINKGIVGALNKVKKLFGRERDVFNISNFLDYPEIFKMYPQLEDVNVVLNRNESRGASYNPNNNTITLNAKGLDLSSVEAKSTLLHEVQHAIQKIEGFSRGGNLIVAKDLLLPKKTKNKISKRNKIQEEIKKNEKEIEDKIKNLDGYDFNLDAEMDNKYGDIIKKEYEKTGEVKDLRTKEEIERQLKNNNLTAPIYKLYREKNSKLYKESSSLYDEIRKEKDEVFKGMSKLKIEDLLFKTYKSIAGETEAYNVEKRIAMTDAQRRENTLEETEDIAREDQLLYSIDNYGISVLNSLISTRPQSTQRQQKVNIDKKISTLQTKKTKASEAEYKKYKAGKTAYSEKFMAEDLKIRREIERLELLKLNLAPAYEQRVKISEELNELNKPFEREVGNVFYPRRGTVSKGDMVSEDSDLGGIYEVDVDGYLFRGVSLEDYNRIKKEGFIDTDLRGAISDKEGINLAGNSSTAFNYLPKGVEGVVMAIKVSDKSGLFMIGADDYVRSSKPIPFTDVEFVTTPVVEGRYVSIKDDKANPISIEKVVHKDTSIKAQKPTQRQQKVNVFEVGDQQQGEGGEVGVIKRQQKDFINAPKAEPDSRPFSRLVKNKDIQDFVGRFFVTNMYDFTTAGSIDLGNGNVINLFGGKSYVPFMMERQGLSIGDVSNLAAFNTKAQAETFIRNSVEGNAGLFMPHAGTVTGSWQFQQSIFESLVNIALDNKIISKKEMISAFNTAIVSDKGRKAFNAFKEKLTEEERNKYGKNIRSFNSFIKNPLELVELLNTDNNYSPDLRKALNDKLSAIPKFQKAIGVKSKEEFALRMEDPLNKGVESGDLMGVVEFDNTTFEISKPKKTDVDYHPSFAWTIKAKIKGIYQPTKFYKSYDVTDSYVKYNSDETKTSRPTDLFGTNDKGEQIDFRKLYDEKRKLKKNPFKGTFKEFLTSKYISSNVSSSAGSIPKVGQVTRQQQVVRFQETIKKSDTPIDIIKKAVALGIDQKVVLNDLLKNYSTLNAKQRKELLAVNIDLFTSVPDAFLNVKGGYKKGIALFNKINDKIKKLNEDKNNKLTKQQVVEKAIEFLRNTSEYKAEADFVKSKGKLRAKAEASTQQLKMEAEFQKSLKDFRPSKDLAKRLRDIKAKITQRIKGGRDLQEVKRQLRNYIRQSLPLGEYTKSDVVKLIREITALTTKELSGRQLETTMMRISSFVAKKNIKNLITKLDKLLDVSDLTKIESGTLKGKKVSNEVRKRIIAIKESMPKPAEGADVLGDRIDKWNERINEFQKNPINTPAEIKEMADLQVMIDLTNAYMQDTFSGIDPDIEQVATLESVIQGLESLRREGKSSLEKEMATQRRKYLEDFQVAYEDINQVKVNLIPTEFTTDDAKKALKDEGVNDPTDDQIYDKISELNEAEAVRIRKELDSLSKQTSEKQSKLMAKAKISVKNLALKIPEYIDRYLNREETLQGLMAIISKGPGELFGGKMRELVYDKINKSLIQYKSRDMKIKADITSNMKRIFGKNWESINRKNSIAKTTGVYKNVEEVNKAKKDYRKNPTQENKKKLKEVIELNNIVLSPNQIYYQYNQYQDPANIKSFANKENTVFKEDPDRIMKELYATLNPKGKGDELSPIQEFAKYQREVLFPSLYDHYNSVYKKIYRTDMPWNQFYAGRIYRDGDKADIKEVEPLMLNGMSKFNQTIGPASTKSRVDNSTPISYMDGTDTMMNYISDMEWFAAFGESIRDISKIFSNNDIKKSIELNHSPDMLKLINSSINKIAAKGLRQGASNALINGTNNIFVLRSLGLSATVALKQLTSIPTYANVIGPVNYLKYAVKNKAEMIKVYKEILANSVYMQDRNLTSITKTIETYSASIQDNTSYKAYFGGLTKGFNYYVNFLMYAVKAGDKAAIMFGGMPNYSYYKAKFKKKYPKATEQEAIDYAITNFEADTKDTQQSADLQDKSYWQTEVPLFSFLNLFKTSQKQYFRKQRDAFRQLRRMTMAMDTKAGKGSFFQNVRTLVLYHSVMPLFFKYVSLGLPGLWADWGEDDTEELAWAAALGNVGALLIVAEITEAAVDASQGKPWATDAKSLPILEMVADYMRVKMYRDKAANAEKPNPETVAKWQKQMDMSLLEFSTLPVRKVDKIYKNLEKISKGDVDGPGDFMLKLFAFGDSVIEGDNKKKPSKTKQTDINPIFINKDNDGKFLPPL